MFLGFDLPMFQLMAFLSTFLPGSIISYSLFRKDEMPFLDKILIGFGIGMVALALIPFLAYLALGIDLSFNLALASTIILYIIAIALLIYTKSYEGPLSFKLSSVIPGKITLSKELIKPLALIIILIFSYMVRVGSFSPVFYELDPYFYTYSAHQILSVGHNQFNDTTAWYPEVTINHRIIPAISYLESSWYSLYTKGAPYINSGDTHDNLLLAVIASMYPPIAGMLAVFFIYLLISSLGKREFGIIAAGIAAFLPVFIYKLSAGEQEVQPYAFFSLFFFYAMFALSIKRKGDLRFPLLAGLAFAAVSLGSSSQILAMSVFMIYMAVQPTLQFLRGDDPEELKQIIVMALAMFVTGPLLGSSIIMGMFQLGRPSLGVVLPFLAFIAYAAVLYLIRLKVPERGRANMMFVGIILIAVLLYAFTPAGDIVKDVASGGFGVATYHHPLDRTIAEQGDAPTDFSPEMGFIAETYGGAVSMILWPLKAFFGSATQVDSITKSLTVIASGIFYPISDLVNAMLSLSVLLLNKALNSAVVYSDRDNSLLLLWVFLFIGSLAYSLIRFFQKKEDSMFVLMLAIIMPPLLVGIIKAKYTIYASVMLAAAIAYVLGVIAYAASQKYEENERNAFLVVLLGVLGIALLLSHFAYKHETLIIWGGLGLLAGAVYLAMGFIDKAWVDKTVHSIQSAWSGDELPRHMLKAAIVLGIFLIFMQFTFNAFADSLVWGSIQPLFQNNPATLAPKFQQFCNESGGTDATVCAAAGDPLGYASKGTDYQYDQELCLLSVYDNYSYIRDSSKAPAWENIAASFRCQRMPNYWIDSMEWLRDNSPNDSRITSWWDYGHWENFFALRYAVTRNDHASASMIQETAHDYIDGTPQDLITFMKAHSSDYALFDMELIAGQGGLGGKYGALNYLSCARDNDTNVSMSPGESQCEADHLWETVFISSNPCTISTISNKTGYTAYKIFQDVYDTTDPQKPIFIGTRYTPYYEPRCVNPTDANIIQYCGMVIKAVPTYCVGPATLASGQSLNTTYYLNETYPNGDLKLNKAFLQGSGYIQGTYHMGDVVAVTLFYTDEPVWLEGGIVKSGYDDRKGRFYDSNLYRGLFLNSIPGFDLVYTTPDNMVKIYKISANASVT